MLRAKVVPELLRQIVGEGVDAAMLLTLDGALMGSVGSTDGVDHKVIGAIAAHTWGEYLHSSKEVAPESDLEALLVELERGRLALASAGKGFLVVAYSRGDAPAGLLKTKVETLGEYLASSLDQIQV
ncbi:hypothetical protein Poli38472_007967 [Pythium oligandrum]|uniref:Roadblock/LAMTOR2 domain-containing protein n=1 Tax=Pythium oligandrum TaxID=41045 RepID=A0A8K1FIS8_PYTOL|nr:hypothetical protein Poli38472_007967 [Pythium oligandrum]|eukprot:TMW65325.1 hypothetical protein Poli38472_007967 [Pythium oligandrum]